MVHNTFINLLPSYAASVYSCITCMLPYACVCNRMLVVCTRMLLVCTRILLNVLSCTCMLLVCNRVVYNLYVTVCVCMNSDATYMLLVWTRMLVVCTPMQLVCTRILLDVLACTCMLFVCNRVVFWSRSNWLTSEFVYASLSLNRITRRPQSTR